MLLSYADPVGEVATEHEREGQNHKADVEQLCVQNPLRDEASVSIHYKKESEHDVGRDNFQRLCQEMFHLKITRACSDPSLLITPISCHVFGKFYDVDEHDWTKNSTNGKEACQATIEERVDMRSDDDLEGEDKVGNND